MFTSYKIWHRVTALVLQVETVSNGTVKYGREFCGTSTQKLLSYIEKPAIIRQKTKNLVMGLRLKHRHLVTRKEIKGI
jgi:hypothetical protein